MISTGREWLHRVDFYRPRFARQVGSKAESQPIAKVKRRLGDRFYEKTRRWSARNFVSMSISLNRFPRDRAQ
jgi:hypothetical protein